MPKRICPFEEDLLPQLKVHVGQKEVNNGVSSEELMKNVYDKTLNLLKEGVKALSDQLNTSAHMDSVGLPTSRLTSCKFKYTSNHKQMLLNNNLQLEISDKVINDLRIELCGCCQMIDQSVLNKCSYCDQILCSFCLSTCVNCLELFCQNCSLPVYNHEEQTMCLNCY